MRALVFLFSLIFALGSVMAGSEDDAIALYTAKYEKAIKDLENGNFDEKMYAIYIMGGSRNPRFVRPLGRELLKDLDNPNYRKLATNDAYVKAHIAWALAMIKHPLALPELQTALEKAAGNSSQAVSAAEAHKKKVEAAKTEEVVLVPTKPGPSLLEPGYRYPNSPDVHWSISDEFKSMTVDPDDEYHQARMNGYNDLNVVLAILAAIGEIQDVKGIDTLKKYLTHPLSAVRGEAALSLGKIKSPVSVQALEEVYTNEKDEEVKAKIAFAALSINKGKTKLYSDLLAKLKSPDIHTRLSTAQAFYGLAMAESLPDLREALRVEEDMTVRDKLKAAIYEAEIDNLRPINY